MAKPDEFQTETTKPEADNTLTESTNAENDPQVAENAAVRDSKGSEPSDEEPPQNEAKSAQNGTEGRSEGIGDEEQASEPVDNDPQDSENTDNDPEDDTQDSETPDNDAQDSETAEERSKVKRANREAAKYRRQASELKAQVTTLQTQLVELLAGEVMKAPEDLNRYIPLEDMLNDAGELDLDKAQQAVTDLLEEKPHLKLNQVNPLAGRRIRRGPPKGTLSERMGATGETTWSGFLNREKNVEDNEFTGSDRGLTRNEEREYRIKNKR